MLHRREKKMTWLEGSSYKQAAFSRYWMNTLCTVEDTFASPRTPS